MSASLKPLTKLTVACLAVIFAVAVGFRLWLLHAYRPGAPWVAGLTLADAEMGRNLLAGRGWVANADMVDRAARAQENRPSMVDLEELLPVDDEKPGVIVYPGSAHSAGYSVWFAISYWLGGHLRYAYSQRMQARAGSRESRSRACGPRRSTASASPAPSASPPGCTAGAGWRSVAPDSLRA